MGYLDIDHTNLNKNPSLKPNYSHISITFLTFYTNYQVASNTSDKHPGYNDIPYEYGYSSLQILFGSIAYSLFNLHSHHNIQYTIHHSASN